MKKIKFIVLMLACMLFVSMPMFNANAAEFVSDEAVTASSDVPTLTSVTPTRDSGVRLEWTASSEAAKGENVSYRILRSSDGQYFSGVVNRDSKYGLFFVDATDDIEVGQTYYYKVREFIDGVQCQDSNVISVTVQETPAAENEFTDAESAAEYLKQQMVQRNEEIVIIYNASSFPSGLSSQLYDMARVDTEEADASTAKEGDYLRYTIVPSTIKISTGIDGKVGTDTSYTFTYKLEYYTSAADEAAVDAEVAKILAKFAEQGITKNSSAYDRAKAVYDYITTTVHYNKDPRKDNGNLMITAYDCLVRKEAQCYGQLLGSYRLLKELDLPVRRVNGKAYVTLGGVLEEVNHGWNIVKIGDVWYNFDATASGSYYEGYAQKELCSYKYLLVSDEDLGSDYKRDADYSSESFVVAHPMSKTSFGYEPEAPAAPTVTFIPEDLMIKISYSKVDGAEGYAVLRSTSANGTFTKVYEGTKLSYEDTNITKGNEYHYKILAYKTVQGYRYYSAYSPRRYYEYKDIKIGSVGTLKCTSVNYNSATLSWNVAENATHYDIYRSTSETSGFEKVSTVEKTTTYTNNGLAAGTTYYYKVVGWCFGSGGIKEYGPESNVLSVKPVLNAPTGVTAKASGYNSVTISWKAVDGAAYYEIYGKKASDSSYKKIGGNYDGTSATLYSLEYGEEYYFKVRCTRNASSGKVYSAYSKVVAGTTKILSAPTISVKSNGYNSVKVSWNAVEGASLYELWGKKATDSKYTIYGPYNAETLSKVINNLDTGKEYWYKVRCYRWVNSEKAYSSFSKVLSVTPKLAAPTNVKAVRNSYNSVKITWNKVDEATYYQVWRSTDPNSGFKKLGTYTVDTLSSISKQLACGTKYYYKVRAYKVVNKKAIYSDYSSVVSATPTLSAPTGVTATRASSTTVKITWKKVEGAVYYQVYRATSKDGKYSLLGTYDESTTSSISKSLKTGTTYYYKVRCYRWQNGERVFSSFSAIDTATP